MDAVDFIKERDRMFNVAKRAPSLSYRHEKSAEEIVREVEEWSATHPCKTRQSVFLEQWPNAELDCQGVVAIDPCDVDKTMHGKDGDCYNGSCDTCRREFWMQEVE
mgnify:CR=1 FL=1